MASRLHQFTEFYLESPPVHIDRSTGDLVRHYGGSHRCHFWAGYDGIEGGPYGNDKTAAGAAWRAGRAYRRQVQAGRLDPLPEKIPYLRLRSAKKECKK